MFTGFALAYAVGVPLYGRVSDFFGVRRVFVLGLMGFAVGGFVRAAAPNLPVLVLGRVTQGIGGRRYLHLRPSRWRRCCRRGSEPAPWAS